MTWISFLNRFFGLNLQGIEIQVAWALDWPS
jgi:hypothetical protein